MPIVRIKNKIIYFAHVPKCAGTSIERYLETRFGPVSFVDRTWLNHKSNWNSTSPQHIETTDLDKLFNGHFFDEVFTVVRHPVDRFVSAYNHNMKMGLLPRHWTPIGTLKKLRQLERSAHRRFDNHFQLMSELVPERSKIFKSENGFSNLIAWFDDLAGKHDTHTQILRVNSGETIPNKSNKLTKRIFQNEIKHPEIELRNMIFEIYQKDFSRFQYSK